jgi:hypothetical protein
VKVLTLTDPWALLVDLAEKRLETRGFAPTLPAPFTFGIHHAKVMDRVKPYLEPFRSALLRHYATIPDAIYFMEQAAGKITSTVEYRGSIDTEDALQLIRTGCSEIFGVSPAVDELAFGDYTRGKLGRGRRAWALANLRKIARPVASRGYQSMWEFPDAEIEAAL